MTEKEPSKAAAQLQAVGEALVLLPQVQESAKEIAQKIASLQRQLAAIEKESAEIQQILAADPELTALARQMMDKPVAAREAAAGKVVIRNPKYVSADDKRRLLARIVREYRLENPEAAGMSYSAIKSVLRGRYGVETASAGLFFRNELREWKTMGGNRNKRICFDLNEKLGRES